jgi:DNA segregation ATPase FtsK/SpoIIIE-like protein
LERRSSSLPYLLAGTLTALGVLLFLSLLSYLSGRGGLAALPGQFLFSSFLWASFFVPLYLGVLALFLVSRSFSLRGLLILNLFILPFVTASVFEKVLLHGRIPGSFLPDLLVGLMGQALAGLGLALLMLFELFLIIALGKSARLARPRAAASRVPSGGASPPAPRAGGASGAVRPARGQRPSLPAEPSPQRLPQAGAAKPAGAAEPAGAAKGAGGPVRRTEEPVPQGGKPVRRPEAPVPETEKPAEGGARYSFPINGVLKDYPDGQYWEIDQETRRSADILMATLEEFKISAEVTGIRKGPVITMFEVLPSPGVKISRIVALSDNIALRLAASRVRIVAPLPGKHAVGIEVPNKKRGIVSFKEMVSLEEFQNNDQEIPIALGKDISGEAQIIDLTQTPHLLIAGATGSGKSVCVNSIISSILYRKSPDEVRFLLIDPKIVELKTYNDIPHLLTPVVTEPRKAFLALQYCIEEMERRYAMLDYTGAKDVRSYNRKAAKQKLTIQRLPYWVILIDEFADLIATTGKEMETALARLAAMARAVGLHLVLATQRPSIDVITGLIKANIPSRIAFMVASKFDSRIIIDAVGAEKLLGQGDMLFCPAWDPIPARIQGTYLSEEEVEAITAHARSLGEPEYLDEEMFREPDGEEEFSGEGVSDPLMEQAIEIVLGAGKASASYLQRRLKVGYNRAARLVEGMETMGIVGPAQGSKPRDILHVPER